jgi:hypothetical protein
MTDRARQEGSIVAWVAFWIVLLSYSALLAWRAIQWDGMPDHYPEIHGYLIKTLFSYLFYEANEPTLVIATLASLCARMAFGADPESLLETFKGRHPNRKADYDEHLGAFEHHAGEVNWIFTACFFVGVAVLAWAFHRRYPDVGLDDWDSVTVRAISVFFLIWSACWSISALRRLICPLMPDIAREIQLLHPDHSGGVGEFGASIVRVSSPLIAVVLLLVSWTALPVISEDYSATFGGLALLLLLLCALPLILYAWLPMWRLHVLLDSARVRMLESVGSPQPNPSVAENASPDILKTAEYVNSMSTWPLGSLSPLILMIGSQGLALLSKAVGK